MYTIHKESGCRSYTHKAHLNLSPSWKFICSHSEATQLRHVRMFAFHQPARLLSKPPLGSCSLLVLCRHLSPRRMWSIARFICPVCPERTLKGLTQCPAWTALIKWYGARTLRWDSQCAIPHSFALLLEFCSFSAILRSWPAGEGLLVLQSASRFVRPLRLAPPRRGEWHTYINTCVA